jgi:hypothetical protein
MSRRSQTVHRDRWDASRLDGSAVFGGDLSVMPAFVEPARRETRKYRRQHSKSPSAGQRSVKAFIQETPYASHVDAPAPDVARPSARTAPEAPWVDARSAQNRTR